MKQNIVSGMRPTGKLHIGHYFGVLKEWLKIQDSANCYFEVADWHTLTTKYEDTENLQSNIRLMLADWIAVGIDPDKVVLFIQSSVKQHAELFLLLSMLTPVGRLELVPTFKEQIRDLHLDANHTTYGLLGYPVLQAADIILYNAHAVPVGIDQLPHIEMTREIARKANHIANAEIFIEPKHILTQTPKIIGFDGRKMSKSLDNAIYLSDTDVDIDKKTKNMLTDPARVKRTDKGNPDVCPVFDYHKLFETPERAELDAGCREASIGCIDCKKHLATQVKSFLEPIHYKRAGISDDYLNDVINEGNKKASAVAEATLDKFRKAIKI